MCRAKPIIEVTSAFVFSRFLSTSSTRQRITHWNGHNPRLRVHFSTLLNTSYAIDQSPDLEPLRICVRYDCRGNACLNLRIKEFSRNWFDLVERVPAPIDRLQCKTRILGATCRDVVLRNGPLCPLFPVQARISTPITKINNAAGDSPTGYGT